jgi:hypothetical protein
VRIEARQIRLDDGPGPGAGAVGASSSQSSYRPAWVRGDEDDRGDSWYRPRASSTCVKAAPTQDFSRGLNSSDGSVALILHRAEGASRLGRQPVEVHSGLLDDFRSPTAVVPRCRRRIRGHGQAKDVNPAVTVRGRVKTRPGNWRID